MVPAETDRGDAYPGGKGPDKGECEDPRGRGRAMRHQRLCISGVDAGKCLKSTTNLPFPFLSPSPVFSYP